MTTTVDPARDMALIHRIFRHGFAELVQLVPTVPPREAARVRAVADHVDFMLDGLRAHHTTEDQLVWPQLSARAAPSVAFVERMEAQHEGVHDGIETVRRTAAAWLDRPTEESGAALATAIAEMLRQLEEHLDEEERDVVPLIVEHLSEDEWEQVGETAFAKFTPAQRFIALGQMLEVATPAEAAAMMSTLPPPVKVLWALMGKRRYRRYAAGFRGR